MLSGGRGVSAHHLCGATGSLSGAFDIQTYESGEYKVDYARTMELAGYNQLFPEYQNFSLPKLKSGERLAGSTATVDAVVPPVLLKAIAWVESSWAQASYDPVVEYGEVGPVLSSHDCGYGIMQVTTGMQNISGVPNLDQAMIGSHYAFNIARGARILADKWNMAPELRPIVGARDPKIIENWYYALWSYNGFAFKNHPLNPSYSVTRAPFSCGPTGDGLGHDRSQYPYQELVMGCAAHPPSRGGTQLWPPQETHLPELTDPKFAEPLKVENWNPCSYSAQCAPMDIPTPNTYHTDPTVITLTRPQVIGAPSLSVAAGEVFLSTSPPATTAQGTFLVANGGSGVLGYRVTSNASWLKVSPSAGVALGTDLPPATSRVTVTASGGALESGRYTAQVTIDSLYPFGSKRVVTVTFQNSYADGTLLKGSGPAVYLMSGGLRRHIPNPVTFEARGLSWGNLQTIPDSLLNQIPTGAPVLDVTGDGNLLRSSGPAIYVTQGGLRRHVAGPEVMAACGYTWEGLYTVSDAALATVPEGVPIYGAPCPRFSPPQNTLLRGSGPQVFAVRGGIKRHVPNALTLEAEGFNFADVNSIPDGVLAYLEMGTPLLDAGGSGNLYRGSGPEIYILDAGKRRHVTGPDVMAACGYGWAEVRALSDATIGAMIVGADLGGAPCPALALPAGTLVKGLGAEVYAIDSAGQRRHITSLEAFAACGYLWGDVNLLWDTALARISIGPVLDRSACP